MTSRRILRTAVLAACAAAAATPALLLAPTSGAAPASGTVILGFNDLGMHCLDRDYTVLSLLPPYNTIHAQVIVDGKIVTANDGITVTYEPVADTRGSINRTSIGKTRFWDFVSGLYGAEPAPDTGLAGFSMPGTAGTPQPMRYDASPGWFTAEGIPLTPIDDEGKTNYYPMMRLTARDAENRVIATTDIVLPVSDEMDCRACHASGTVAAARPDAGWVSDADPEREYRLNILKKHDDREGGRPEYVAALAQLGYDAGGLYETVVTGGRPVLCAACHASNALPGTGIEGIRALTRAIHGRHATVTDPTSDLTLDDEANRSACYRCHPGSDTRCLRGVMGSAVAPNAHRSIECQSCHGTMTAVGAADRVGWLEEPSCQSCHTGTALVNSGQIRYESAFTPEGNVRSAADPTFATTPDVPAAGFDLFRFSFGHGGLACEACHGSTHAVFPSAEANDNVQSIAVQGVAGPLGECSACHGNSPSTTSGGPHGLHPIGQVWVNRHGDAAEHGGAGACRACHGTDYRGTVLSRTLAERNLSGEDFGPKHLFRGAQVGCYLCHNGPQSEGRTRNDAPVAKNGSAGTKPDTEVVVPLSATDTDGPSMSFRIVDQPLHGMAGASGANAVYRPDPGFTGADSFTFAASDSYADSNLATIQVSVEEAGGPPPDAADLTGSFLKVKVKGKRRIRIQAKLSIMNAGTVAAGQTTVEFRIADDPEATALTSGTKKLKALKTGKTKRVKWKVKLPKGEAATGRWLIAVIDPQALVDETNRENDTILFGPLN